MLTSDQCRLVEDNINLCYKYLQKSIEKGQTLYRYGIDDDDMIEIAYEALVSAAKTFDPEKKIKFSTYFWTVCKNLIAHEVQGMKRAKRKIFLNCISLEQPVKGSTKISIRDTIPSLTDSMEEHVVKTDLFRVLREEIAKLPEKPREAIELYYIAGYSVREVADMLKVDTHVITNRTMKGRRILKQCLIARKYAL